MRTSNLDKVLAQVTGAECQEAADELGRYLAAGLTATRELLAAFLNDLNDECLARGVPTVTAARRPAFLNHPARTMGFHAGWPGVISGRRRGLREGRGMRGPGQRSVACRRRRDADGDR
jgi:hypothetical protein